MASSDITSLIDWNSPIIEFNNKPLIPLPNIEGQIQVCDDNPFDAIERQINKSELFELVSNITIEEIRNKYQKPGNASNKSTDNLIEISNDMKSAEETASYPNTPVKNDSDLNTSPMDLSPISPNISEIRSRLSALKRNWSLLEFNASKKNVLNSSAPPTDVKSEMSTQRPHSFLNNGFIGNNLQDPCIADSLILEIENESLEDLNSIIPQWDELALTSSSDEESEILSSRSRPHEQTNDIRKDERKGRPMKKCVRVPLTTKDPNIRLKTAIKKVQPEGPLKAVVPLENMTKNGIKKRDTTIQNDSSKTKKVDSTSNRRRSAPIATSTPANSCNENTNLNVRSIRRTDSKNLARSCPPSPDSTSTRTLTPKSINSGIFTAKMCSRKLALNVVSSSSNAVYSQNLRKVSPNRKYSPKPVAAGVKSCVKNKENRPLKC